MRGADRNTIRGGTSSDDLMENAASGLCAALIERYAGAARIVVVCGPGNNGGDGLAAARRLAGAGLRASVFTLLDPARYAGDARANFERLKSAGVECVSLASGRGFAELSRALSEADVVVDALFGTGLSRALSGAAARAVRAINRAGRPVVAADVPSGLSSDAGLVDGPAVRAAVTVAFAAPKLCHVLPPASGLCGRVVVADIGIPRRTLEARARRLWLTERSDVRTLLPPRPLESHKADFGRLAIVAGSRGKAGAAILAAHGAPAGRGGARHRLLRGVAGGPDRRGIARGDDVRPAREGRLDLRGRGPGPSPGDRRDSTRPSSVRGSGRPRGRSRCSSDSCRRRGVPSSRTPMRSTRSPVGRVSSRGGAARRS